MIKNSKFSFLGCKKIILAALVSMLMSPSWAQSDNLKAEGLSVPTKFETTNLKTEGYIWQFDLQANPETQSVTAKLLNPHPKLKQLNQRAMDIAKEVDFQRLNKLYIAQQNQPNAPQQATALSTKEHFSYKVQFINHLGYEKRPSERITGELTRVICNKSLSYPEYRQFYYEQSNAIYLQLEVTTSLLGNIESYTVLNRNKKPYDLPEISNLLSYYKFYSINQDGQPITMRVIQPFSLNCPNYFRNKVEKAQ